MTFLRTFLIVIISSFLLCNTNAQTITVKAKEKKQPFMGTGGTCDSYIGHWFSMNEENRKVAAKMIAEDINLVFLKNYINGTPETVPEQYEKFSNFIKEIRTVSPDVKVQICVSDLPDHLERKNRNGDNLKGEYDPSIEGIYDSVANYYFSVLRGFKAHDIVVDQLDLLNEPGGTDHAIPKGHLFDEVIDLLKDTVSKNSLGITMPQIAGASGWAVDGSKKWLDIWQKDLPGAWDNLDIVTTHGYRQGWISESYQNIKDIIGNKPFQNNEQTGKLQKGDGLYEIFGQEEPWHIGDVSIALRISDAINGGVNYFFIFNLNNSSGNNAALIKTPKGGEPSKSKVYSGFRQLTSLQPAESNCIGWDTTGTGTNRVLSFRKDNQDTVYLHITNVTAEPSTVYIDITDDGSKTYGIKGYKSWVSDVDLDEKLTVDTTYSKSRNKIAFDLNPFSVNSLKIVLDTTGYETELKQQSIQFDPIGDLPYGGDDVTLKATLGSRLQPKFEVVTGAAKIENGSVKLTGAGQVIVKAFHEGNDTLLPVTEYQSFCIIQEKPVITVDGNKLTSSKGEGYQWLLNGSPISGATDEVFYAIKNGKYAVSLGSSPCETTSDEVSVTVSGAINVALNKPVTVSSVHGSYSGAKAVDGKLLENSSRWIAGKGEALPQWLEIDLQGSYSIYAIGLYTGIDKYSLPLNEFQFQSWDGTKWVNIKSVSNNQVPDGMFVFEPQEVSKVRLYITEVEKDWVKLFEIEVYGDEKSNFVNAPAFTENEIMVYPNPVTDKTTIRYSVKTRSDVDVDIFDSNGQKIVTLQNGIQEAGNYTLEWNPYNNAGGRLGSGIYFCRIVSNGFASTTKIIVY